MYPDLLDILRCPATGGQLACEQPEYAGKDVRAGWLVSETGEYRYPIRNFIPRFVSESNYAGNFGMQWNKFRRTQPQDTMFNVLERWVPFLLSIRMTVGRIPVVGSSIRKLVPVANYQGISYPLSRQQLREFALLDTFDMFAPKYDSPQTVADVERFLRQSGLRETAVLKAGHLVGRGRKG